MMYISWKLSERETRCSAVETECLVMWWVVGSLHYSLLGRSDHTVSF